MSVDKAYISGLMPFLTSVYILVESVSMPAPFVKWVIMKSSKDIVNAIKKPDKIPGERSGSVTLKKALIWDAPKSSAAS